MGVRHRDPAVRIAIIDDGFREFDDLVPNVRKAHYTTELFTHGGSVASVLAARGDDQQGMTGMMWNAGLNLIDLRDTTTMGMTEAMEAAIREGAKIVNISRGLRWGEHHPSTQDDSTRAFDAYDALRKPLRELRDTHRQTMPLMVLSAGNANLSDARWNGYPRIADDFPDNVIVVGSVARPSPRTGRPRHPIHRVGVEFGAVLPMPCQDAFADFPGLVDDEGVVLDPKSVQSPPDLARRPVGQDPVAVFVASKVHQVLIPCRHEGEVRFLWPLPLGERDGGIELDGDVAQLAVHLGAGVAVGPLDVPAVITRRPLGEDFRRVSPERSPDPRGGVQWRGVGLAGRIPTTQGRWRWCSGRSGWRRAKDGYTGTPPRRCVRGTSAAGRCVARIPAET